MLLQYADDAHLYVPLARLDLVQKYRVARRRRRPRSTASAPPSGKRARRASANPSSDMADELLELYAERKTAAGPRLSARFQLAARI